VLRVLRERLTVTVVVEGGRNKKICRLIIRG